MQDLSFDLAEPHDVRTGPPLNPVKVLLDGMLITTPSLVWSANLLRVNSIPLYMLPTKLLNSTSSKTDLLRNATMTDLHLEITSMIIALWVGSHVGCHHLHPYFPCALIQFPGGHAPWYCWERRWDWLVCSSPGLPSSFFKNGSYVWVISASPFWVIFPFPVNGDFTGLSQLLKYDGQWYSNLIWQFPQDPSNQVAWTCTSLGFIDGLEPDLLLQWAVLHYSSPCLCLLWLGLCG